MGKRSGRAFSSLRFPVPPAVPGSHFPAASSKLAASRPSAPTPLAANGPRSCTAKPAPSAGALVLGVAEQTLGRAFSGRWEH